MKISIILTFFILGTFGFTHLFAQDSKIIFEHFELEQGINANIPCGFQDRTGYLWFGSLHGVFRYDGYSFKPFVTFNGDSSDVTAAEVKAICDDSDGNIWIGHIQGLDKLNPTTEEVRHYKLNPEKPLTDLSNHVLVLLEDRDGNLWIGTGNGLYLFNKSTETFKRMLHDSTDSKSIIDNSINDIYEDKIGNLWFGTDGGLDKLDKTGNKFIHSWNYQIGSSDMGWGSFWIHSIFEDSDGTIWLGTSEGVVEFNRKAESFTRYKNIHNNPESLSNNWVNTICEDLNGNLWLGTVGIDIFNKKSKIFSNYKYDEKDPGSISSNNVATILLDRSGTIWITTYGGGVNKHILPNQNIKEYVAADYGEITNTGWGNLVEDNNGKIWIGRDKGLISFDPEKETFKEESLKVYISGILLDKEGTLWINSRATWNLYYKKNNEKQIRQFFYSNGEAFSEGVSCMYNCRDGSIWIGTIDGKILKLNQHRKVIEQIAKYDNSISVIYEDKTGLLWIGTNGEGAICYDPGKKTFTRFYSDPKDAMTLNANQVNSFCEDGTGTLWIVTNSTLNKFDSIKQKCIRWGGKEGFPPDTFSLIDDAHGNLWMSTGSGAVKYDPLTKKLTKYNDIKLGWGYRVSNGELYFVSTTFFSYKQCIMRFDPDNMLNNNFIPPIVITSFKKFEKPYPLGKTIDLDYTENFLSFEFSALSYINSAKNQYAYKMEGVDKDWVNSGSRRFASYPNLDPGEYIFRVKGSNNDGLWNEEGTSLSIIISPPWWKTLWAYTFYAFIFIIALYGIRRYELNRAGLKNKIKMDEAVLKEKEETDKMKSRFFANISHEFRTPLTLILGPAEKIFSNTSDNHIKDADIIRRNSRRLLQLINQLLDLSRLEAGKLKLEASKGNIVSFVKGVALSFESLAESKDITLKLLPEKDLIELYFDREKMMKILTNILSNAFKFIPEEGKITVSVRGGESSRASSSLSLHGDVSKGFVEIKIRDTGIGITPEEIPKLFDRFYQVDSSHTREYEGTGIGLALTKELVELHRGSIRVESEKGNPEETSWTEFTLEFPLGRDHLKDEEILAEEEIQSKVILSPEEVGMKNLYQESMDNNKGVSLSKIPQNDIAINEEKTIILVVEDNYDMRQYIRESLDGNYLIEEAVNGEQGVRKAEKIIPDLIVSDMMMPKMDGNELVKILKNDEKTSHIPIILLTAKAGHEDKLEGLEIGADDYLTKPFDIKELQVRIKNLISIRKKLQEKFSKAGYVSKQPEKKLSSIDERFMNKIMDVIEKHLSEEEFSIEEFGSEVGMSRSQIHRKLKALSGKSASVFLRSVRLAKARKMMEEQKGNISEIAYLVGFSSPSYFTKCFKDEFGYPPSEIM